MAWLWIGKEGPHPLPEWAYDCLQAKLKSPTPLYLSCVEQVSFRNSSLLSLIRVFDALPDGMRIDNFASFDEHPELILYEGYMEYETGRVEIETVRH